MAEIWSAFATPFVVDKAEDKGNGGDGEVEEGINELLLDIQREDTMTSVRVAQQKAAGIEYRLLCSKCDSFLCSSKDIKTYKDTQYCVCNPLFWSKIRSEKVCEPSLREAMYGGVAKLYCAKPNCKNSVGRIVCIEQTMLPVLAASAVVFEFGEGIASKRRTVRKWINVKEELFTPDSIRNYDLKLMSEAADRPAFIVEKIAFPLI